MTFDLMTLLAERRSDKVALFDTYLNGQLVQVLKTIGFDADYVKGEGAYLFDTSGKRYLDLLSGFGVFALGRNHPTVVNALSQVLTANLPGLVQLDVSPLAGLLAERLNRHMPWLDKYFFANSGAESVEAAIKFARYHTGRSWLLHCTDSFHGLTYGALSATGDAFYRRGFTPLVGDFAAVPFNDLAALEQALGEREIAAFIVEPIQGKGVNLPDPDYLREAARLCRRHGALFIADEIQTGLGRTGRFLCCEHYAVEPDIVLLAKSLSGGFAPVGAVAMRRPIFDSVFDRMDRAVVHGSTFSKNDLAMAAGLATLAVLEEEALIARAADMGRRLIERLQTRLGPSEFVREIRGKGLMIGIETRPPDGIRLKTAYTAIETARQGLFCQLLLIPLMRDHGILAQVAGQSLPVIKLLPPLVIEDGDVDWIVGAFESVLRDAASVSGLWELGRTLVGHALAAARG